MGALINPLAIPGLALSILCHAIGVPTLGLQEVTGFNPGPHAAHPSPVRVARADVRPPFNAPRIVVRDFTQTAHRFIPPVRTTSYFPQFAGRIYVVPSVVDADPVPTVPPGASIAPEPAVAPNEDAQPDYGASPKLAPDPAQSVNPAALDASAQGGDGLNASASLERQELALLALVNRERTTRGEQALTLSPLLCEVARGHSEDMCRRHYFDHIAPAPGPQTPMDRYLAAVPQRPDRAMLGENIYYRSATDSISVYAAQAHDAFMHSPGHRANILTPQYDQCGIGIYRTPATGEYWVTEEFLTVADPK